MPSFAHSSGCVAMQKGEELLRIHRKLAVISRRSPGKPAVAAALPARLRHRRRAGRRLGRPCRSCGA